VARQSLWKMPSFAGTRESLHGRPRKLTKRVAQMLTGGVENDSTGTNQARQTSYGDIAGTPSFRRRRKKKQISGDGEYLEDEDEEEGYEASEEVDINEGQSLNESEESEEDEDNHTWCICNQKSHGDMVACDNKQCRYEWFHYSCVGITATPKGRWYCSECTSRMNT